MCPASAISQTAGRRWQYSYMGFDDLVNNRLAAQKDAAAAQDGLARDLTTARAIFDSAVTTIGRSAAQILTSRGVALSPIGRIHEPMLREKRVVQTGGVWHFGDRIGLALFPDGRWCVPHTLSATNLEYRPWERKAPKGSTKPILDDTPQLWLTGAILKGFDQHAGEPTGSYYVSLSDITVYVWLADRVPMINTAWDRSSATPFEDWAADAVARLLGA